MWSVFTIELSRNVSQRSRVKSKQNFQNVVVIVFVVFDFVCSGQLSDEEWGGPGPFVNSLSVYFRTMHFNHQNSGVESSLTFLTNKIVELTLTNLEPNRVV